VSNRTPATGKVNGVVTPEFAVTVEAAQGGRSTVVRVTGEIDIATADGLTELMRAELAAAPVVLDLGPVTFMDSSGIRMLDALQREAEREDWELLIAPGLTADVRRLLEITGMLPLLRFAGDNGHGS
jgi:anti-sigma B factor antagonist